MLMALVLNHRLAFIGRRTAPLPAIMRDTMVQNGEEFRATKVVGKRTGRALKVVVEVAPIDAQIFAAVPHIKHRQHSLAIVRLRSGYGFAFHRIFATETIITSNVGHIKSRNLKPSP